AREVAQGGGRHFIGARQAGTRAGRTRGAAQFTRARAGEAGRAGRRAGRTVPRTLASPHGFEERRAGEEIVAQRKATSDPSLSGTPPTGQAPRYGWGGGSNSERAAPAVSVMTAMRPLSGSSMISEIGLPP